MIRRERTRVRGKTWRCLMGKSTAPFFHTCLIDFVEMIGDVQELECRFSQYQRPGTTGAAHSGV